MLTLNETFFPYFLYAETHFRFFSFFPSILFKREPEVIFDVPYRIDPDVDLPVLLIINDLRRFHAEPEDVAITVTKPYEGTNIFKFYKLQEYEINHPFRNNQRVFIFPVPKSQLPFGQLLINAKVRLKKKRNKMFIVFNDNLNTSTKYGLSCFRSSSSLPGAGLCLYGDLHVHSQFSQSHVEFGPPIEVIDIMAKSCGLSFIAITDHSYDLACDVDNYLIEDKTGKRWKSQNEILARDSGFNSIMIQGEEISCKNKDGATVHLGALGISEFIPGSTDGARRKLYFKNQLTIKQAVDEIQKQGGIAFAAHPGSRAGLLERLLLHRGNWRIDDLKEAINGIQGFNSGFDRSWERSKLLWINLLQQGYRIPIFAGNDAHGDFCRYRSIKTPFLSIYEDNQRFMGYGKTGIYGTAVNSKEVIKLLKQGITFITTGPYISINYSQKPDDYSIASFPDRPTPSELYLYSVSTNEFGYIKKIVLFFGEVNSNNKYEKKIFEKSFKEKVLEVCIPFSTAELQKGGYVRAEAETALDSGKNYYAFTSCCWIEKN